MKLTKTAMIFATGLFAATAQAALPTLYEEALARQEEKRIINAPIAGVENKFWFDYRIDITKAQMDLTKRLGKANKVKKLRHAWEEYAEDLREEREEYVRQMKKRGFRSGAVTFETR